MKILWTLLKLAIKLAPIYQITASLLTDFLKRLRNNSKWAYNLEFARKTLRYVGEQLVFFADILEDWTIDLEEVQQVNQARIDVLTKYAEGKSAKEEKVALIKLETEKAEVFKRERIAALDAERVK